MVDGKRRDAVLVPRERVARPQLHELVAVGQPPEDPAQRDEQVAQTRRAVDRDRRLAAAQRERLQHPGKAEVVVGVVVRQEDLVQVDEPDLRSQQLPLRPLGAVEQQPLAAAPDERRRGRAQRGRRRAGRPEEDDVEVHGSILGAGTSAARLAAVAAPDVRERLRLDLDTGGVRRHPRSLEAPLPRRGRP